jgi:hypothetical protein
MFHWRQFVFQKLTDIFRSDDFVPTTAVFPDINKEKLARELKLEEEGRKRGSTGQPEEGNEILDHVELQAVARVEDLRRRGLDNFETNRRVYSERLNLAVSARMQVETESNNAKARFSEDVTKWRSLMVTPREKVQETFRWRNRFRELNKLERPADQKSSLVSVIGLALVMIILEAFGNAYLFAQANPLGLLGGLVAAFLVSAGNVSMSTIMGMGIRYINCRGFFNLLKKFAGLVFVVSWLGFAMIYNLGVAHFRDAAESGSEWREAGIQAIQSIQVSPFGLQTMESYVLFLLGFIISIVSCLKGYNSSDAYPGYSKVTLAVVDARNEYVDQLEDSLDILAERRDEAVEALREANDEVHRNINDSVDALYGQRALQSNLTPFLEQCDMTANYLLAVYRDANRATREDEAPKYFKNKFAFDPFNPPSADDSRRSEAEAQVKEVSDLVYQAIKEIFSVFNDAVKAHYDIDELEGTNPIREDVVVPAERYSLKIVSEKTKDKEEA